MIRPLHSLLFLLFSLYSLATYAQAEEEAFLHGQLYTGCAKMPVFVDLGGDVARFGVTKEAVQGSIEQRLRSARLLTSAHGGEGIGLNVRIGMQEITNREGQVFDTSVGVYLIQVRFLMPHYNEYANTTAIAKTWTKSAYGTGGTPFIFSHVAKHVDEFLADYLRINKQACDTQ